MELNLYLALKVLVSISDLWKTYTLKSQFNFFYFITQLKKRYYFC